MYVNDEKLVALFDGGLGILLDDDVMTKGWIN